MKDRKDTTILRLKKAIEDLKQELDVANYRLAAFEKSQLELEKTEKRNLFLDATR